MENEVNRLQARWRGDWIVEALMVFGIIAISLLVSRFFIGKPGSNIRLYQEIYGIPALMLACGRGYTDLDKSALDSPTLEKIEDFLDPLSPAMMEKTFDCSQLPPVMKTHELDAFYIYHLYLYMFLGYVWKFTSVSWQAFIPFLVVFHCASVLCTYAFLRQGSGKLLSFSGTVFYMLSSTYTSMLLSFRDYTMSFFFMGTVFATALICRLKLSTKTLLILSSALGMFIGIGFGFRTDTAALIPFIIIVIVFLVSVGANLYHRAICVGLFVCCFIIAVSPLYYYSYYAAPGGGSTIFHYIIIGQGNEQKGTLGLATGAVDFGSARDLHQYSEISAFNNAVSGQNRLLTTSTKEYDKASLMLFSQLLTDLPANIVASVYCSIWRMISLPFYNISKRKEMAARHVNQGAGAKELSWKAKFVYSALNMLDGLLSPAAVICLYTASLLMLTLYLETRMWAFIILMALYFGSYGFIQFEYRHLFFHEAIGLWVILSAIQIIVSNSMPGAQPRGWLALSRQPPTPASGAESRPKIPMRKRVQLIMRGGVLLAIALSMFTILASARDYQQRHLTSLIERLLSAPSEPLELSTKNVRDGYVLMTLNKYIIPPYDFHSILVKVMIDGKRCANESGWITAKQRISSRGSMDFSKTWKVKLDGSGRDSAIIFPAYMASDKLYWAQVFRDNPRRHSNSFEGILVSRNLAPCVRISEITDVRDFPIANAMYIYLEPGWKDQPLYDTFTQPYVVPWIIPDISVAAEIGNQDYGGFVASDLAFMDPDVRIDQGSLVYHGESSAPDSILAKFRPVEIYDDNPRIFSVEGSFQEKFIKRRVLWTHRPGILVEMRKDDKAIFQIGAPSFKPIEINIPIIGKGKYQIVIYNDLARKGGNSFSLSRWGWTSRSREEGWRKSLEPEKM